MRRVAFLYLGGDAPVKQVFDGIIREGAGLFTSILVEWFSAPNPTDKNSFQSAIARLAQRRDEFDTLVLITHGTPPANVPKTDIKYAAQTAECGPLLVSNWHLVAKDFEEFLSSKHAFVAICCFSCQEELDEAFLRILPGFVVASIGEIFPDEAIKGTVAFFRETRQKSIPEISGDDKSGGTVTHAEVEHYDREVFTASNRKMRGWIPGS